jgi:ribosomal-protein-alanine N-acetyltransferase
MFLIRRGSPSDLAEVAAIQEASPQAARWNVAEYLQYDLRVADAAGAVAGFLVSRTVAAGESESLNLAVLPDFRRRGVATELLQSFLRESRGNVFLEVRESNREAREFYKSIGFEEFADRPAYYATPDGSPETAIVMKFHSC